MSLPRVSIVIPVFNQARFVLETVGSAVRQTYANLEVIVVDDGSTDGSSELLNREFGDRITLIRQKNGGPSAALNAGILASGGDLIALMGGDDICIDERIETQVGIIERCGDDVIFSKPMLVDDDGNAVDDGSFPVFFRKAPAKNLLGVLLLEGNFICAPTALIRRRVVSAIGVFHPGLIQLQDYEYWMRALAAGFRLSEHEPRVVKYRRHSGNLSSHKSSFASNAEMIPVIKMILDRGRPEALRAALPHLFVPTSVMNTPLSQLEKTFLLLAHSRDEVRMAGIEYAVGLLETPELIEATAPFGFNLFRCLYSSNQK